MSTITHSRARRLRIIAAIVALIIIAAAGIAYGVARSHRPYYTMLVLGDTSATSRVQRLRDGLVTAAELDDDQVTVIDLRDDVSPTIDAGIPTQLSDADRQRIIDRMTTLQRRGGVALIAPAALFDTTTDQQTCTNDLAGAFSLSGVRSPDSGTLPLSASFAKTLPDDAWYYTICTDGETTLDPTTNDDLSRRCEYDADRGSTICATDRGATEYRPAASVVPPGDDAHVYDNVDLYVWEQHGMLERYAATPQGLDLRRSATWTTLGGGATTADADYVVTFLADGNLNSQATTLNDAFARYLKL